MVAHYVLFLRLSQCCCGYMDSFLPRLSSSYVSDKKKILTTSTNLSFNCATDHHLRTITAPTALRRLRLRRLHPSLLLLLLRPLLLPPRPLPPRHARMGTARAQMAADGESEVTL